MMKNILENKTKRKKGFLTRNFIIAGLLFSGIVAFFVVSIAGISNQYDSSLLTNEDFAEQYDTLTEQTGNVGTARNASATGEGLSFKGTFDVAFQSTFTVIQMVFNTLNLFGNMTGSFAEDFGLDPVITKLIFTIALSILTVLIVWTWISSISRGKI